MDVLNNPLSELVNNDPTTSPQIILGNDFPDISWEDGNGYLQPSSTYTVWNYN